MPFEPKQMMMSSTAGPADIGCGDLTKEQVTGFWGWMGPKVTEAAVWMKAGRDSARENPGSEVVATTLPLPVINSCFRGDAKISHVLKPQDCLLPAGQTGELEESLVTWSWWAKLKPRQAGSSSRRFRLRGGTFWGDLDECLESITSSVISPDLLYIRPDTHYSSGGGCVWMLYLRKIFYPEDSIQA